MANKCNLKLYALFAIYNHFYISLKHNYCNHRVARLLSYVTFCKQILSNYYATLLDCYSLEFRKTLNFKDRI